jgi:hypothetical protein
MPDLLRECGSRRAETHPIRTEWLSAKKNPDCSWVGTRGTRGNKFDEFGYRREAGYYERLPGGHEVRPDLFPYVRAGMVHWELAWRWPGKRCKTMANQRLRPDREQIVPSLDVTPPLRHATSRVW